MSENQAKLVYSSDPERNKKCPKCRALTAQCQCATKQEIDAAKIVAVLRIEKAGRGGKVVSVIDRLPNDEPFLKDLAAELKAKCGAGGTFKKGEPYGVVEIQGDKRDIIRNVLSKRGMTVKG